MKKIGIFGSYGGASIGDEAILKGLLDIMDDAFGNTIEVIIFTLNENVTRTAINENYQFSIEYREIKNSNNKIFNQLNYSRPNQKQNIKSFLYKKISDASPTITIYIEQILRKILRKPLLKRNLSEGIDTLIFGGGNILMDMYYKWPLIMNLLLKQFSKQNTRILFLGVGAGPIQTSYGRSVIKNIVKDYYVSTRDEESLKLLNKLKKGKSVRGTDLAFGLYRKVNDSNKEGIGVSVIPYHANFYWPKAEQDKYNFYKNNVAKILDKLIEDTGENIEFFASNHPTDIKSAKEILEEMCNSDKVSVNNKKMNVHELLHFLSNKKLVIGTRLHSLILSSCVQTNFFAINYQPKVNYFLNGIGLENRYVDIKCISKEQLNDKEINSVCKQIRESFVTKGISDFSIQKKKESLKKEILRVLDNE